jgi:hypothetical protein
MEVRMSRISGRGGTLAASALGYAALQVLGRRSGSQLNERSASLPPMR